MGCTNGITVDTCTAICDAMNKENIWKLLARKMAGEATSAELKELHDLVKNDPDMNYMAETFARIWNAVPAWQPEENSVKKILQRIKKEVLG